MKPNFVKRALLGGASLSLLALSPAIVSPAMAETNITFYYPVQVGGALTQIIDGYVAEFEAANPDIKVEAIYSGNYVDTYNRALTAAKNGTPPTAAVLLSVDLFQLLDNEVIAPLDQFIKTDEDKAWLDGFMLPYRQSGEAEGQLWSVPFQRSTLVAYYNKDAFRAAGLDPEAPPKTWDELAAMGQKLTLRDASGNVTQWGIGLPGNSGSGQWLFEPLVAQNGARLRSDDGTKTMLNAPQSVEALQFWVDLENKFQAHPKGIQEWATTPADFLEGRLAMAWTTTGNLGNIRKNAKFDFGIAPLPGNPNPASVLGGGSLYVFEQASDAEKAAAWKLIRFLTTPELLADWSIKTGYVAPRDDSWDTPAMKDYVAQVPAAEVARKQIPVAVPEFSTYENNRINQLINDAIQAALTGSATPQQALDRAQAEAERILKPYQN